MTTENVGTTIKVYLPSIPDAAQRVTLPPGSARHSASDVADRTILLVDDDATVRAMTAMMLNALGYAVVEAKSGSDALNKIDSGIDLMLTDFAMPNMTGAELADIVHHSHPSLPIVFITGFADTDILDVDQQLILQKPYREDELAAKLTQAFQRRETEAGSPRTAQEDRRD